MDSKNCHSYYTVKFKAYQPYEEYQTQDGEEEIKFIETEVVFIDDLESALGLIRSILDEPYKSAEITYTYE